MINCINTLPNKSREKKNILISRSAHYVKVSKCFTMQNKMWISFARNAELWFLEANHFINVLNAMYVIIVKHAFIKSRFLIHQTGYVKIITSWDLSQMEITCVMAVNFNLELMGQIQKNYFTAATIAIMIYARNVQNNLITITLNSRIKFSRTTNSLTSNVNIQSVSLNFYIKKCNKLGKVVNLPLILVS